MYKENHIGKRTIFFKSGNFVDSNIFRKYKHFNTTQKKIKHFWLVGWLVGFGFNGPLRQYFSLYRAVSQREGERGERIDESKNVQTTPTRTYCKRNRPLHYCNPNCRTPRQTSQALQNENIQLRKNINLSAYATLFYPEKGNMPRCEHINLVTYVTFSYPALWNMKHVRMVIFPHRRLSHTLLTLQNEIYIIL